MLILLDLFEAGEEGFWNLAFAGWRQRGPVRSISRGSISVSQPFLRVAAPCSPVVAGLGYGIGDTKKCRENFERDPTVENPQKVSN